MKLRKKLFVVTVLLSIFGAVIGIYSLNVNSIASHKQSVPFFVLQSSETKGLDVSFVSDLDVASSKDDKSVYLFREDTQDVTVIDSKRKTEKIKSSFPSAKAMAVNSQGRIFVAGDSELSVSDAKGNRLNNFPIPATTTSLAALNNGSVVIAAADSDGLLTVFDEFGKTSRRIGNLKRLDTQDVAQNRFLNAGKVTVNQSGDIYYVSTYSPVPTVQKFSKQGILLKEFAIEGAAVELQLKRANKFLKQRKLGCVGGYFVIRTATVDPTTGHLWIGMNGLSESGSIRQESGVLYEYNSDGEKIAEYALTIASPTGETNVITDVKDIAVNAPHAYLLTSQGKVYHFDLKQRSAVTPKEPEVREFSFASFIHTVATTFSPTVSAQLPCPEEANFTCFDDCPAGSTPTRAACDAELRSSLQQGERIISSSCQTGTGENGGCSGTITGCRTNGVRVTYSASISCNAAPTPTPTPEGYEGLEYVAGGGYSCHLCEDGDDNDNNGYTDLFDVNCQNCIPSPIVIDTLGNGFEMSNAANGVMFDITATGHLRRISWTQGSDDAWLALDRNGNGTIDNGAELFGNFTPQPGTSEPQGFIALAEYDKPANGGNNDGKISQQDSIFGLLRLWKDANRNGVSEQGELHTLLSLNVEKIDLKYKRSKRTDEHGNQFRFRAKVFDTTGGDVGRWSWDVFLVTQ